MLAVRQFVTGPHDGLDALNVLNTGPDSFTADSGLVASLFGSHAAVDMSLSTAPLRRTERCLRPGKVQNRLPERALRTDFSTLNRGCRGTSPDPQSSMRKSWEASTTSASLSRTLNDL